MLRLAEGAGEGGAGAEEEAEEGEERAAKVGERAAKAKKGVPDFLKVRVASCLCLAQKLGST
jgi:hypothetical protein